MHYALTIAQILIDKTAVNKIVANQITKQTAVNRGHEPIMAVVGIAVPTAYIRIARILPTIYLCLCPKLQT